MPEVIDFDERSIWRNVFDPAAWQNLLSGVGEVAEVAGEAATTWEQLEKIGETKPLTSPPPEPPPYDPNLTWRDFKFTPNVTLIAIGCGLLVLAWMLKK